MHRLISIIIILLSFLCPSSCFVSYAFERLGGRVYRSLNGGHAWTTMLAGLTNNITDMVLLPPSGVGIQGATWSVLCVGESGSIIHAYRRHANDTRTVWSTPALPFRTRNVVPSTTLDFRSVSFLNSSHATVVGQFGVIYTSDDSGASWHAITSPTLRHMNRVLLNEAFSIAVGNVKTVLRSVQWGVWSLVPLSAEFPLSINLYAVAIHGSTVIVAGNFGVVGRSSNGGLSFAVVTIHSDGNLYCAHFHDTVLYVAGDFGTLLKSTDDGLTFTPIDLDTTSRIANIQSTLSGVMMATLRDRVLLNHEDEWTITPANYHVNFFGGLAMADTSLLAFSPTVANLSCFRGQSSLQLTIQLINQGTTTLTIDSEAYGSSQFITTIVPGARIIESEQSTTITYLFATKTLLPGWYYENITFSTNSLLNVSTFYFSIYIASVPVPASNEWWLEYWWGLLGLLMLVVGVIWWAVKRRMRHVIRYNKKLRDRKNHIGFWTCCPCNKVVEHDEDSQFWDDQLNSDGESQTRKWHSSSSDSDSQFEDLSDSSPSDSLGFQDYESDEYAEHSSQSGSKSFSRSKSGLSKSSHKSSHFGSQHAASKLIRIQQKGANRLAGGDATSKASVRTMKRQHAIMNIHKK